MQRPERHPPARRTRTAPTSCSSSTISRSTTTPTTRRTPPGRTHLKDKVDFVRAAKRQKLPEGQHVKPIGEENEHPGYASQSGGNSHLVGLGETVLNGKDGKHT